MCSAALVVIVVAVVLRARLKNAFKYIMRGPAQI